MGRLLDEDAVIKVLECWQKAFRENSHYVSASDLSLVVKDVRELPTVQPEKEQLSKEDATSDLISRQAVLDAIVQCTNCGDEDTLREYVLKHNLDNGWTGGILEALDAVKDLPPAQPEPHEGHWINGKCDLCGEHAPFWAMASTYHESNYCPHCGAKMKGEQHETD